MPLQVDLSCLHTRVRNPTGARRFYAYLGPRGRHVDAGDEVTQSGSPESWCMRFQRVDDKLVRALEYDLENGYLELMNTPKPVFYDEGADEPRVLRVHNGAVGVRAACWTESAS